MIARAASAQALIHREKIVNAPRAKKSVFRIRLFGDFRVVDSRNGTDATPRSRKGRALVAFLALMDGRSASRDRLVGVLWSDRGEEQARASLRQSLAEFRTSPIGKCVAIGRRDVTLTPGAVVTDVEELMSACGLDDLVAVGELLDAVESEPLSGLDGLDPSLDEWLAVERQRIQDRLVKAVLDTVDRANDLAVLPARRALLGQLQRIDAANEDIARRGMMLDHQAGDIAAVHRRYRQLDAGMHRAIDVGASPETQRLFRQYTTVAPVTPTVEIAIVPTAVPASTHRRIEPPILVVPPFTTIGESADGALLARICHDDLQVALGSLRDLRVLAVADPRSEGLAAACGASIASYLLDGSVRADGPGWRINLRLTALDNGLQVWSRQLLLRQTELGPAIDDLVHRIAAAMLPVVERDLSRVLDVADQGDPAAYPLYFAARARLLSATSLQDVRAAAHLLERCIEADPAMTNAYLHLARLYNTDFMQMLAGHDHAPLRGRAFDLSTRAVALDPDNWHVHARLGWCYLRRDDVAQARQRFDAAADLTPHYADGLDEIGFGLVHLGDLEEAHRLIARAFELNPFPPDEYFSDLAVLLALAGDHKAAEEQFEIGRNGSIHYLAVRAANLALLGRDGEARAAADDIRRRFRPLWQGTIDPCDADIVAGMLLFLPLQRAQDRALFKEGLTRAGLA